MWIHLTARAGVLNRYVRVEGGLDARGLVLLLDGAPTVWRHWGQEVGLLSRGRGGERAASVLAGQHVLDGAGGTTVP